jgi:hypothetical protein
MNAVIENWPSGGKRVTARFEIEQTPRGERAVRTTTGAPKKLTFARKMRIVDGDDGRTYIAELRGDYIIIMRGDMKFAEEGAVWKDNPRHAALAALFA